MRYSLKVENIFLRTGNIDKRETSYQLLTILKSRIRVLVKSDWI